MLTHLAIKNYALIEELEIYPAHDFSVITGETGAGKSIMLGAIGLLLGERADKKALLHPEQKCIVEGTFELQHEELQKIFEEENLDYDTITLVRREIAPNGKSRSFINDTPVTLDVLKKVGQQLVDIHSQHDNLLLSSMGFQLRLLDVYAKQQEQVEKYRKLFVDYKALKEKYDQLIAHADIYKKELDYKKFLLEELQTAQFQADEQDRLEADLRILENSEEIKSKLHTILESMSYSEWSVVTNLRIATTQLTQLSPLSPIYEQIRQRVASCYIELQDVIHELENENETIDVDPATILESQQRLSLIYHLQKKHQAHSVAELLKIQEDLYEKVNQILNFDEEVEKLQKSVEKSHKQLLELAEKIYARRQEIIPSIEQEIQNLFQEVGMPNAKLKISQEKTALHAQGMDKINCLFSANKGIAPVEIKNVASGGEFSRLMLCIKYILAGKTSLPTLIFDEIDTGISGEVAQRVGKMMQEMSKEHQIIAITHLHQIAAKGKTHYYVYKDNSAEKTISKVKSLTNDERITEIATMISGAKPSEAAMVSAKELLMDR